MKKTVSLLFLLFIAHFSFAQKVFDELAFRGAMDRYLKSPVGFLQSEATPDFMFTGADDKPLNLQQTKAIYDRIIETDRIFSNVSIRQNGTTAVVTGNLVQKIKNIKSGNESQQNTAFTYVFTQIKGKWLIANAVQQATPQKDDLKTEFLMEVELPLQLPVMVGSRIIYPLNEGKVKGKVTGKTLQVGGDFSTMTGIGDLKLDVRLVIETNDKEHIYASYTGYIHADPETFGKLASGKSEEVDASQYYFRTNPVFETASEKYKWLNHTIAVGVGTVTKTGVRYKIYAVK